MFDLLLGMTIFGNDVDSKVALMLLVFISLMVHAPHIGLILMFTVLIILLMYCIRDLFMLIKNHLVQ